MGEKKNLLKELLEEITPTMQAKTDAKMILARRIYDAKKRKKWSNKDLAEKLNRKHTSEITKWLSGTHNFTVETLVEIENALGINLLNLDLEKERSYYHFETQKAVRHHKTIHTSIYLDSFLETRKKSTRNIVTYKADLLSGNLMSA